MEKVNISKKQLIELYIHQNKTTFQIADKLKYSQTTIWKKLKEFRISPKLPGIKRVELSKKDLKNLYINKKLSTWQIEKETSIPRSTIHRKLKEFKIKIRDRSESHIIHKKSNFSGNLIEKAYLIGFGIGDLGVRKQYPNSKTVCVASGSTIKEQIQLIDELFQNYSKVWTSKSKKGKTNVQVILDNSFEFLLSKNYPKWINKNKKTFFSFLAGFTDAEGSIGVYNNQARYSLGNYDFEILSQIKECLEKYGIKCKDIYSDKRKGKLNNEGYKYNQNYHHFRIDRKKELLKLFLNLIPYTKHKNKIKALNIAIQNIQSRSVKK